MCCSLRLIVDTCSVCTLSIVIYFLIRTDEFKPALVYLKALKESLARIGAVTIDTEDHCDTYFNHPNRDFANTDEALHECALDLAEGAQVDLRRGRDPRRDSHVDLTYRRQNMLL